MSKLHYKKDSDKNDGDGSGESSYGKNGKNGEECHDLKTTLDNLIDKEDGTDNAEEKIKTALDTHLSDEIPKEVRDQMVNDVRQRIKNRGNSCGEFEEVLKKLKIK